MDEKRLLEDLGKGGAQILRRNLVSGSVVGLAWGTSVSATVGAVNLQENTAVKVVQLVGAMGARNTEYDGHALVQQLAEKLGGDDYFINAPYFCQTPEMAKSLLATHGVLETVVLGKNAQVALLGIGSTDPQYSSYYLAGYVPLDEIEQIRASEAVGDIAGIHFDVNGNQVCHDFYERLVTIRVEDLLKIPIRIGVAGGIGKVKPILGALRGNFVSVLITDSVTAEKVLELDNPV